MTASRVRARPGARRLAVAIGAALVVALAAIAPPAARAAEYPTWAEVEAARSSAAAASAKVAEITALLAQLDRAAAEARARADARAQEYEAAQQRADAAAVEQQQLQAKVDTARSEQEAAARAVAATLSTMARSSGPIDRSWLLAQPDRSEDLLYRLQLSDLLARRFDDRLTAATQARNTLRALVQQADSARRRLAELRGIAEKALTLAQEESAAADQRVQEGTVQRAQLTAQRDVLQQRRSATEADYQRGEDVRRAAEAATRAAAAAAAAAGGGAVANSGWANPITGYITSGFGPRPTRPVPGVNRFHSGVDVAAPCGRVVYAAAAGRVDYSGTFSTYGLWVLIDNGGGVQTGYAHNSRLLVPAGARVSAGQPIALVGSTGLSSGCHSHVEVRVSGVRVDARTFLAARGVRLGG